MDWSTCRGRFKKVSVHANMTLLIGGLMNSLWIAQNHKKIITPANGIMFQHHILTEHKQDSSINAMNFWTGTREVFHLPDPGWSVQSWGPNTGIFEKFLLACPGLVTRMLTHVSIPQNYTVEYNYAGYVHACINAPYLFAIGQFWSNGSILSCTECHLYTCLTHTVPINVTKDSVFFSPAKDWFVGSS